MTFVPIQSPAEVLSFLIALVAFVVTVAGVFYALSVPRAYRASAVIQVLNPVIDPRAGPGAQSLTRRVQAIEQRIMARDYLLALAERYHLFEGLSLTTTEKLNLMRRSITIEAIAGAQAGFTPDGSIAAIIVSASARSPEIAARLANDLAEEIVRENAEERRARTQAALRFFAEEEARIEAELRALEHDIAAFRAEHEAFLEPALALQRDEMAQLAEARFAAERALAQAEAERATLEPEAGRLIVQRRINQLDDLILQRREEIRALEERMEAIRAHFQRAAEVDYTLAQYLRRLEQVRNELAAVAERRREAELAARLETDDQADRFVLLERALPPDFPVSRSRRSIVALAAMVGLGLGFVVAVSLEWFRPVLRTAPMVERAFGMRPVVTIPYIESPRERRGRRILWAGGLGLLIGLALALLYALRFRQG